MHNGDLRNLVVENIHQLNKFTQEEMKSQLEKRKVFEFLSVMVAFEGC
jgi:hypothetical protein